MSKNSFSIDEWYHVYNRGVDKRVIFSESGDYDRFVMQLYAGNSITSVHVSNQFSGRKPTLTEVLSRRRGAPLISIGAYCLMPTHFHLLVKEISEGGLTSFMRKVATGYTMYFNKKNYRTGPLLSGTFHSSHVADDRYFKRVVNYIHANPAEIVEPGWKSGTIRDKRGVERWLSAYRYSSLQDYLGMERLERSILDQSAFSLFDVLPDIESLVDDAHTFGN